MAFSAGFDNITETTADFWADFTGGDASFTRYRLVKLTLDGDIYKGEVITSNKAGGSSSSFDQTITGLTPGTRYDWEAQLGYEDSAGDTWLSLYDSGYFITAERAIEPWSWTYSNGSASASQTRRAYNVLMGTAAADQFSHLVWNDLVDKVAEMREARGYAWDRAGTTYPSASGCKVSAGETLSARKYNGVRYNIGSVFSTGISDQSPGDPITGYKIYHLTDILNRIIADI